MSILCLCVPPNLLGIPFLGLLPGLWVEYIPAAFLYLIEMPVLTKVGRALVRRVGCIANLPKLLSVVNFCQPPLINGQPSAFTRRIFGSITESITSAPRCLEFSELGSHHSCLLRLLMKPSCKDYNSLACSVLFKPLAIVEKLTIIHYYFLTNRDRRDNLLPTHQKRLHVFVLERVRVNWRKDQLDINFLHIRTIKTSS
jgi:hypothetical protein